MEIANVYQQYFAALEAGNRRQALTVARSALDAGIDIRDLYMDVLQPAMYEVGRRWEINQFTVAQEHLATAITQSVMAQIYTAVVSRPPNGYTMVATCIGGELHELGIRMVADFFEMEGWDVFYLGANVPAADVVHTIQSEQAQLLAVSVTLGGHILQARDLLAAVRASAVGNRVKIMVGGQPFNRSPDAYRTIGADFTAKNAREAARLGLEVVQ